MSGASSISREFESQLTRLLGRISARAVHLIDGEPQHTASLLPAASVSEPHFFNEQLAATTEEQKSNFQGLASSAMQVKTEETALHASPQRLPVSSPIVGPSLWQPSSEREKKPSRERDMSEDREVGPHAKKLRVNQAEESEEKDSTLLENRDKAGGGIEDQIVLSPSASLFTMRQSPQESREQEAINVTLEEMEQVGSSSQPPHFFQSPCPAEILKTEKNIQMEGDEKSNPIFLSD